MKFFLLKIAHQKMKKISSENEVFPTVSRNFVNYWKQNFDFLQKKYINFVFLNDIKPTYLKSSLRINPMYQGRISTCPIPVIPVIPGYGGKGSTPGNYPGGCAHHLKFKLW